MSKSILVRSVACLTFPGLALLCMQPAAAQVYSFPPYADAAQVGTACEGMLTDLKLQEAQLQNPADTAARPGELLAALDALTLRYEDTLGPLALLASVHPDKAIRDASEACELKYEAFNTAFLQNAAVYARIKAAQPADASPNDKDDASIDGGGSGSVGVSATFSAASGTNGSPDFGKD